MALYISYPDIPFRAIQTASNVTWDTFFDYRNTISTERYQYAKKSAVTGFNIEYDLGLGNTSAIDHIIVARADLLQSIGVTSLVLASASDGIGGSYSDQHTISSFNTQTLYGPGSKDLLVSGISLTAARTWKATAAGASSSTHAFSKLYFGSAFSMGQEPIFDFKREPEFTSEYITGAGSKRVSRHSEPRYVFNFTWEGVSDDKVIEFQTKIASRRHLSRFFLFTTSVHQVLNQERIVHAKLTEWSSENSGGRVDWNTVTATFEEIIG